MQFDWADWRPELISEYLNLLTPRSAIFNLNAKSCAEKEGQRTEPYYGTQFNTEKIPTELLNEWASATANDDEKIGHAPPNKFIPDWPLAP